MSEAWRKLGKVTPTALVEARLQAHHAVQWVTKAARANLAPQSDDGQSSLLWNKVHAALCCEPLTTPSGGALRFGLALDSLRLIALENDALSGEFSLEGAIDASAGAWIDSLALGAGLKPPSPVVLPYALPPHPIAAGGLYAPNAQRDALAAMASWYGAADELLREIRASLVGVGRRLGPLRCWPHHFDIAVLLTLGEGEPESAAAVGIGMSPGDTYYAEPYFYVSPWPRPTNRTLPQLAAPAHWHDKDFLAAIVTASSLIAAPDPCMRARRFFDGASAAARELLDASPPLWR